MLTHSSLLIASPIIQGVGRMGPPEAKMSKTADGVLVPDCKWAKTGVARTQLLYNEYIVYDTRQVTIRYAVQIRFDFK